MSQSVAATHSLSSMPHIKSTHNKLYKVHTARHVTQFGPTFVHVVALIEYLPSHHSLFNGDSYQFIWRQIQTIYIVHEGIEKKRRERQRLSHIKFNSMYLDIKCHTRLRYKCTALIVNRILNFHFESVRHAANRKRMRLNQIHKPNIVLVFQIKTEHERRDEKTNQHT